MRACCISPCSPAREAFHGEDRRPAPHTHLPALQSRYPHPSPTGRPPTAAGVGAERGRGRGHNTPIPAAAGAFDSFVPERWGPRLQWAAASRHSTPPGRPSRTMVTYSIVRSGLVVELSEPLPGGAVRMPTPRMPPHVRAGMTAEITALLNKGVIEPTADHPRLCLSPVFSSPIARGTFV